MVVLWSLGLQISGLGDSEGSGLVEIFSSAIKKFSTSAPMSLIDNASTHWGRKPKEFCFCYLLMWDYWATRGLKGLIKVTSLLRACDVTILSGRNRNKNHSLFIVFLLKCVMTGERHQGGHFHSFGKQWTPKSGQREGSLIFCLSQEFIQQ